MRARQMMNFKTCALFYRPCVGNYIIHGIEDSEDFKFDNAEDAIAKGNEMYQILIDELKTL